MKSEVFRHKKKEKSKQLATLIITSLAFTGVVLAGVISSSHPSGEAGLEPSPNYCKSVEYKSLLGKTLVGKFLKPEKTDPLCIDPNDIAQEFQASKSKEVGND